MIPRIHQSATAAGFLCALAMTAMPFAAVRADDDLYDLVALTDARPVLIRLHVQSNGKPLHVAWDAFIKYLFTKLDRDKDGMLSKEEAARVPTAPQFLSAGLVGAIGAGAQPIAPFDKLDANKDGRISFTELCDYYRANGFAPMQFQAGISNANPLGGAQAILGGGRTDPSADAVSTTIFSRLDADKDGKLSPAELAAAPDVLLRLDEEDDETVTPREIVPDAKPNVNMLGAMAMSTAGGGGGGSVKNIVPLPRPGSAPADFALHLQKRYGPKADKPEGKKLRRADLGLDATTFARLDANRDGLLDSGELPAFAAREPDLEFTVRLGEHPSTSPLDIAPRAIGKVMRQEELVRIDLGRVRIDVKNSDTAESDDSSNPYSGIIQQQFTVQLQQADTNNDGVIDATEGEKNRAIKTIFKAVDQNGDGKITEAELKGYMADMADLQSRAQQACATLAWSDQSRGLFDLLDTNGDGRLSIREMRAAATLPIELNVKAPLAKSDIPTCIHATVSRGPSDSGAGNLGALLSLYRSYGQTSATATGVGPDWFRRMDRNRDGDISRKEFLFSDEQFRRLDLNGDGLISVQEATASRKP